MLRFLAGVALFAMLLLVLGPRIANALSWILAFFVLLMLGDLLLAAVRKRRS